MGRRARTREACDLGSALPDSVAYTRRVEDWLHQHPITAAFVLGGVFFVAWVVTSSPETLGGAILFFIVALLGDRLKEAPGGFKFFKKKSIEAVTRDRAGGVLTSRDSVVVGVLAGGELAPETPAPAGGLRGVSWDAVAGAAEAMEQASTPEELTERMVHYVELRSVFGFQAAAQPTVFIGYDNQPTGQIVLVEPAAGAFGGLQAADTLGVCLVTGESFAQAPWAIVTSGDLKLGGDGAGAATAAMGMLFTDSLGHACARWTVRSPSTVASTISIVGAGSSGGPLALGANNGPSLNVPAPRAPGSVQLAILAGNLDKVLAGVDAADPAPRGPAFRGLVSTAMRAFKTGVVVSALSAPIVVAGSEDVAVAGNIAISETLHGQLQAGEEIVVTILPRASQGAFAQETFIQTAATNLLPVVTTNARASGLLASEVRPVIPQAEPHEAAALAGPALAMSFRFMITQGAWAPSLGQITVSNIHLVALVGAVKGPVLVSVMGKARNRAAAFQAVVAIGVII